MYYGAKFICVMDNSGLRERVPRGNGTMCRFRSIKLKPGATSIRIKYFHGRKVTTVNAKDVQYMECEVIDNSSHIKQLARRIKELSMESRPDKRKIRKLRQQMERERKNKVFHLEPITTTTNVKCSVNKETPPLTFKTKMTQFPINLADAVTGHKLQGRTLHRMGIFLLEKLGIHSLVTGENKSRSIPTGRTRFGYFIRCKRTVHKIHRTSQKNRKQNTKYFITTLVNTRIGEASMKTRSIFFNTIYNTQSI